MASQLQGGDQVGRTAPGNTGFPAGNQVGGHGGQLRTKVTVQRLGAGEVRSLQDSHHPLPFPQAFQGHCYMPRRELPTEPLGWFSARRGIYLGLVPLEAGSGGQTDICWPIGGGGGLHPRCHPQPARFQLQGRWGSQAWLSGKSNPRRDGGTPEKDFIVQGLMEGRGCSQDKLPT